MKDTISGKHPMFKHKLRKCADPGPLCGLGVERPGRETTAPEVAIVRAYPPSRVSTVSAALRHRARRAIEKRDIALSRVVRREAFSRHSTQVEFEKEIEVCSLPPSTLPPAPAPRGQLQR